MALRIAVIGVGHLGQHHARLLSAMEDVELVAVVDTRQERANAVAERYGTAAFADAADVMDRVDAVCVATPTVTHVEVALPFIEAGIPALVEKPLAAGLQEADKLVDEAAARGVLLATGHTERFNPAVTAARQLVSEPRFIEIHRLGTFPERSLDIDVIFDLMIHDLDLLRAIVQSPVAAIEAVGVNVLTPRVDIANARLRFESGCIANVTASRISRDRVRKARFFQSDAYVSVDYAAQEVEVYRLVPQGSLLAPGAPAGAAGANGGRPSIQGGRLEVAADEPLRRELLDFVDAVRWKRRPEVTGEDGRAALALATRVAELIPGAQGAI
jgi:predicted dehydrogenase